LKTENKDRAIYCNSTNGPSFGGIGCSETIYPNEVLLLEENPNSAHLEFRGIDELSENLGSPREKMAGETTAQIEKN
jgi:hypothetical protein